MKKLLALAALALLCYNSSYAQTINGTILDQSTGEGLIGANIVIQNTSIGTSTDFDGKYQFKADPGTYTLVTSYLGFTDKIIEGVVVKDNEVTYLDVMLSDATVELDLNVTVTAKSIDRSENALMLLQRKSDKIQDGISSQEMSKFNLGNAASAMTKVSGATVSGGKYIYIRGLGDRYSLTQLNGLIIPSADPYRNSAQLDLIPTSLLDNIITSKTFTPDQPGTFTGGNVNIKTKSLPEQFFLTFKMSAGYNRQNNLIKDFQTHSGGKSDYFGFDDGTRARPKLFDTPVADAVFAFDRNIARIARNSAFYNAFIGDEGTFTGQADFANKADLIARSLSQQFDVSDKTTPLDHGISLSFGNQFPVGKKNSLGVIFTGSFNNSYTHLANYDKANWVLRFTADDFLFNQGDFKETLSTESPTLNGMLGLSYKIGNFNTISFMTIYNHSADKVSRFITGERPDNILNPRIFEGRSLEFRERDLINYQLSGEHSLQNLNKAKIEWKISLANSALNTPDLRFFENDYNVKTEIYEIPSSDVRRPFHFFRELEDEQIDLKLDFTLPIGQNGVKIKTGGLLTQKTRFFQEERYLVEQHDGYTRIFDGDPDKYLADDNYGLISSDEASGQYIFGNYIVDETIFKNSYEGTDDVLGIYGMVTIPITQRLKFVGGARYESTNLRSQSRDLGVIPGNIEVNDILPSANLIYALNERMNLRGSFSKTLSRPNMREIAPFDSEDVLEKLTLFGNTDLQKTDILNYDLRWEYFINPGEIFAISSYYKDFTNPIVLSYRKAPNPEIEFVNVGEARLFGLELELRKDLSFINPGLKNLKFSTNVSYINSRMDAYVVPGLEGLEPESRPFEGQAPFVLNLGLIYSNLDRGIDATLSLNSIGDRLNIIGREGTPDIYDKGRNQLDFSFSKKIKKFNIGFSAQNLLNDDFIRFSEHAEQEWTYFQFKRGINLGVSLSYTIN